MNLKIPVFKNGCMYLYSVIGTFFFSVSKGVSRYCNTKRNAVFTSGFTSADSTNYGLKMFRKNENKK